MEILLKYFFNFSLFSETTMHVLIIVAPAVFTAYDWRFGLDNKGQEAYLFVSPRDIDVKDSISRVMMGNNCVFLCNYL